MNILSREWIEGFAFIGIYSAATGHVAGEVASMVKSPIAKVVVLGATMAANAYVSYRIGEFIEAYSLRDEKPMMIIHTDLGFDFKDTH